MVEASNPTGRGAGGAGGSGEDGGMTFDDLLTEQTAVSAIHRHTHQHSFVGIRSRWIEEEAVILLRERSKGKVSSGRGRGLCSPSSIDNPGFNGRCS